MTAVEINYLAVFVSAVIIFLLGGLWYSPVLFAKPWMSVINKTEEELKKNEKPKLSCRFFTGTNLRIYACNFSLLG
ncbi:MAG: DUF1761 family protein [Ignavibacteriales bacterium]|nr:MAG: DUF1761 family protein [Ignavibacteriales bacterium]